MQAIKTGDVLEREKKRAPSPPTLAGDDGARCFFSAYFLPLLLQVYGKVTNTPVWVHTCNEQSVRSRGYHLLEVFYRCQWHSVGFCYYEAFAYPGLFQLAV